MPEPGRAHPAPCRTPAHTLSVPVSCPRARKYEAADTAPGYRYRTYTDQAGLPEPACQRSLQHTLGISQPGPTRALCRAIRQRRWQHQLVPSRRQTRKGRMGLLIPYSTHLCSFPPSHIHVVKQLESLDCKEGAKIRWVSLIFSPRFALYFISSKHSCNDYILLG